MSSLRYPFGNWSPNFPHRVEVLTVTGRDLYGKPVITAGEPIAARCQIGQVELLDGGQRAMREGLIARLAARPDVVVGALVRWNGTAYTIIQIAGSPDLTGSLHALTVYAVVKREEAGV